MDETTIIQPLFILSDNPEKMGDAIISFSQDDYNKDASGTTFIEAQNDAQAISAFLREYKNSSETLRSYAKEIERLLLWCIHVANVNIASLRRDHLLSYQDLLKTPSPKKLWCGPSCSLVLIKTTL